MDMPLICSSIPAITGSGFVALYMSFENTAGRSSGYALAVRSVSERSVFYACSFMGDQGTLLADGGKQLYVDCDIAGGRDLVSGGGAAIFHKGTLYIRAPPPERDHVVLTAHRRRYRNSSEGFVFRHYAVKAAEGELLPRSTGVYLGRPLGSSHSRVVFMWSFLDYVIAPQGWVVGVGRGETSGSVYYGEYRNTGPGSDTTGRVTAPGVKKTMTAEEAASFAGLAFIEGDSWLLSVGVPILYDSLGNTTTVL
ncbi:hypothetical protein H6P81_015181 [Aristolochia fimbriata]|uniref:Pectinesterase catalytic domain-containing protein n=1 Tax=Aristolochia fimbriata TaxID=158543 RepID=A0AAV7E614_ARIFI|nr:hypothetical protein H6P81_015181 [Aristolochia fimbriata]